MSKAITEQKKAELAEKNGFSLKEVDKLIARYRQLDKSKTMTDGVTLTDMLAIPEFVGHPFVRDIITLAGRDTGLEGAKTAGANKNPSNPTNKESIKNALQDSITEEEEDKIRFNVDNFVKLAGKMSSRASDNVKQNLAWRVVNYWNEDVLRTAEMFRFYRRIMAASLTDDQCLAMAYRALNLAQLSTKGEMSREEFFDFAPPHEIRLKFTADLQLAN